MHHDVHSPSVLLEFLLSTLYQVVILLILQLTSTSNALLNGLCLLYIELVVPLLFLGAAVVFVARNLLSI